jgi:hypothetical protein
MDEPAEVIHQRLIDLWATSDNIHHIDPLVDEAERHGLDLHTCGVSRGSCRPRKP